MLVFLLIAASTTATVLVFSIFALMAPTTVMIGTNVRIRGVATSAPCAAGRLLFLFLNMLAPRPLTIAVGALGIMPVFFTLLFTSTGPTLRILTGARPAFATVPVSGALVYLLNCLWSIFRVYHGTTPRWGYKVWLPFHE